MERDFEKDIIELDAAIKSNTERDNTFTLSVLQRAKEIILQQKEKLKAYEDIGLIPTARTENRWIPVEERLPDEAQEVLVTRKRIKGDYVTCDEYDWDYCAWASDSDDIIAWMSLPEPYKP